MLSQMMRRWGADGCSEQPIDPRGQAFGDVRPRIARRTAPPSWVRLIGTYCTGACAFRGSPQSASWVELGSLDEEVSVNPRIRSGIAPRSARPVE